MPNTPKVPPTRVEKPKPNGPAQNTLPGPEIPSRPANVATPFSEPDPVFEEDFTNVSASDLLAVAGYHEAKLIDFERSDSKSGNPQYTWVFRITRGPSKDIELRYWTSLLPQARWKVAETLMALGIKATGSVVRFRKSDLIGRPCIIEVAHEQYEGRTVHKVKKVYPPSERQMEDQLPGGGAPPAPPAETEDDDIPF